MVYTLNGAPLLSNITHDPDGQITGCGCGVVWLRGRGCGVVVGLRGRVLRNRMCKDDNRQSAGATEWRYSYDLLDRLTSVSLPGGQRIDYIYDALGNLTKRTQGQSEETFIYAAGTSRLAGYQKSSEAVKAISQDASGHLASEGVSRYSHDGQGRLAQSATEKGVATYGYDGRNRRVWKEKSGARTDFVHDENGRLLGEYDGASGLARAEYLWLDGVLIGVLKGDARYRVHADHLGTPRSIADAAGQEVWRWEEDDPYGGNAAQDQLSGQRFEFNLRYPGQYYDEEMVTA